MTSENRDINLPMEDQGKWAQFWITKDELVSIVGIIQEAKNQGLRLSQSVVIRKIMEKGWDNIDLDAVRRNPLSLFANQEAAAK